MNMIDSTSRTFTSEDFVMTSPKRQKISMKSLEDLPDEVQLQIYSCLNIRDLIRCAQVSKRIRGICNDEYLWQKMNMSEKVVPANFIKQILDNGCKYISLYDAQIKGYFHTDRKSQLKCLDMGYVAIDERYSMFEKLEKIAFSKYIYIFSSKYC